VKYKLIYTFRADRDIRRLEPGIKKRLEKILRKYEENPLKYAEKLTDSQLGTYRFRIGDYRVVFDLEKEKIIILRVGHRGEIYRR